MQTRQKEYNGIMIDPGVAKCRETQKTRGKHGWRSYEGILSPHGERKTRTVLPIEICRYVIKPTTCNQWYLRFMLFRFMLCRTPAGKRCEITPRSYAEYPIRVWIIQEGDGECNLGWPRSNTMLEQPSVPAGLTLHGFDSFLAHSMAVGQRKANGNNMFRCRDNLHKDLVWAERINKKGNAI